MAPMKLAIALILSAGFASAQTRPRPEQIVNVQQVRISGDTRPGTLVRSSQLQDGRSVMVPGWLTDPADAGKPTACVVSFYGYAIESGPLVVLRSPACYTQVGLALLLTDPAWLSWWSAQGGNPVV